MDAQLEILLAEGREIHQIQLDYVKDHKVTKSLSIGQIAQWVDDVHKYASKRGWVLPERGTSLDYVMGWEWPAADYIGRVLNVLEIYTKRSEINPSSPRHARPEDDGGYDLAISFAGEDRDLARYIADQVHNAGFSVFFDEFEKSKLWGKNLYDYLFEIYNSRALYCIIIISEPYAKKMWTNHERSAAQAAAFSASREYILPLRVDDTKLPGLADTIGYIDARTTDKADIVKLIIEKLRSAK
jgi:TIR domain